MSYQVEFYPGPEVASLYPGEPFAILDSDTVLLFDFAQQVDIIGTDLTVDSGTMEIKYPYTFHDHQSIGGIDFDGIVTSDDCVICTSQLFCNLSQIAYGTEVRLVRDGVTISKLFVKKVDKIGPDQYRLELFSEVGLLGEQTHLGGVYIGQTFPTVLLSVTGGLFPYIVDSALSSLQVYGYLPAASRRENLHKLLFAYGVMMSRNTDRDIVFRFIDNASPTVIPGVRFYQDGTVTPLSSDSVSAVQVTEYSYFQTAGDETVSLFDNTSGETANNTLVVFPADKAPAHDLTVTGTLSIVDSGPTWTKVSGVGVLSGKRFSTSSRTLSAVTDTHDLQTSKTAVVDDNTLISPINSANVLARVLAYYSTGKVVNTAFVHGGEQCGDLLAGIDPYGGEMSGFLSRMECKVSGGKIKATAKLISGYTPTGQGSNYSRCVTYTGSGTIDLAALVAGTPWKTDDLVMLQLIGGGEPGKRGEDGGGGSGGSSTSGNGGRGGDGGDPGQGGRTLTVTVHLADLTSTSISYSCGSGGTPETTGNPATSGGDTTAGAWTTANGQRASYGVANPITGEVYASPGEAGIPGGDGAGADSSGGTVTHGGQAFVPGDNAPTLREHGCVCVGGFGGGPAYGTNGFDGQNGETYRNPDGSYFAQGGSGGLGAIPIDQNGDTTATYGRGGNGGHGGGGGGGGGGASSTTGDWWGGNGGEGGRGGYASPGGPGCVNVYV